MGARTDTYFTYPTPHGPVTLRASERGIAEAAFGQVELAGRYEPSALANRAANELQEYLAGKRRSFDVALDLQGSAFQRAVWEQLRAVPYGETRTATEIAAEMGKPGAHRSIGAAIRACRLAPFVPAHRVPPANATGKQANIFRALAAMEQRAATSQNG